MIRFVVLDDFRNSGESDLVPGSSVSADDDGGNEVPAYPADRNA
jgi:hypothetical protein